MIQDLESQSLLDGGVEIEQRRPCKVFKVFGGLLVAAIVAAAVCHGRAHSPSAAHLRGTMNKDNLDDWFTSTSTTSSTTTPQSLNITTSILEGAAALNVTDWAKPGFCTDDPGSTLKNQAMTDF